MPKRVFVTGIGMISSIGDSYHETVGSIQTGRSGIGPVTLLETNHRDHLIAGEIKHTDAGLALMAGIHLDAGITRTALLGLIAAKEAIAFAGLSDLEDAALISGTTVGGMVSTEKFYSDFINNDTRNDFITSYDCGESTERIARFLGINGYLATINTACSSSANAIMAGARLIKDGKAGRVIAGGVDALSKFTLNGFNTLMILDQDLCKPFDENRNGLNLGEGACFLILEAEELTLNKKVIGEIAGYGNANDAFHQTASSPDGRGPFLAMKKALESIGLEKERVDYINAHGTATQNNDLSEGIAIERLFLNDIPYVSSTKSLTGHLLGAAGAFEAGISIIAMNHAFIPPNLNFQTKMKELCFSPVSELLKGVSLEYVLSNSFGFGGNNTSLILKKC